LNVLKSSLSIINQMEPYGIDCVDQPVIMYNLDALKDVKNATHVPIAAHESTWTMYDMLKVIKNALHSSRNNPLPYRMGYRPRSTNCKNGWNGCEIPMQMEILPVRNF